MNVFTKDYFVHSKISNYSDYHVLDNDWFWKPEVELVRSLGRGGRLLDVGCAFGYFLKRISSYFQGVYGVDISSYALGEARRVVPKAKLARVDLNTERLPFRRNFFDVITAFDVLEHTKSVGKTLGNLALNLKDNGFIVFSVPVRDTWAGKIYTKLDRDVSHHSVLSEAEVRLEIAKAGLEVVRWHYFVGFTHGRIKGVPVEIEFVCQKTGAKIGGRI